MKKILSLVLALLMCAAMIPFAVFAEDAGPIIFDFLEDNGEVPFDTGKNGKCYFYRGSSTVNPEVYTWNSGTMTIEDGFAVFTPGGNMGMMELDTLPEGKKWSADKKLTVLKLVIKTGKKYNGANITIVSQGNKYKKVFKTDLSGEWQELIFDLNDTSGWTMKGESGAYESVSYSPMKNDEGKQVMTGGYRVDFPSVNSVGKITIDYFGLFGSVDDAKAYKGKASIASTVVLDKVESSGSSSSSSSSSQTASTEPAKPKMTDILKKELGEPSIVSTVPESIADDDKIIYRFANVGAYQEDTKQYPMSDGVMKYLQTWGSGTFENTATGILKFTSNSAGRTLFEAHPKSVPSIKKMPFAVFGYRSAEDYKMQSGTYFYSAANTYRALLDFNLDGQWHYDVIDMTKLDWGLKDNNYKKIENAADKEEALDKIGYGAFRFDFPTVLKSVYYIDFIGFFVSETTAKEYAQKALDAVAKPADEEEARFTYMKGYDDGSFRPNNQMTRAEACTVIARLMADENTIAADRKTAFTDVKKDDWYYGYVTYLEDLGYLPNYSGEFKPNQNITRSEFVKLVFEAGGLSFSNKRPNFTDVKTDHPYYKEIAFAAAGGVVNGYDNYDGTYSFKPEGEITRAEIATIINRILGIEPNKDAKPSFSDLDNTHWAFGTIMAIAAKAK